MDKWTQILTEMVELSKANTARGDRAFRVTVAWQRKVPLETRALVASAAWRAADAFSKNGIALRGAMVLIASYDTWPVALAAPCDGAAIPGHVRSLAVRWNAKYVVLVASGLTVLEPRLVEAVLAHEFAHIVLGHCDSTPARFGLGRRWIRRMYVFRRELAADGLAARLGYGADLLKVIQYFQRTSKGSWVRVRDEVRKWKLRTALAALTRSETF